MENGDLIRRTFELICKVDHYGELTIRLVTPEMAEYKVERERTWYYLSDYYKCDHPNKFRKLTIQYNSQFYERNTRFNGKQTSLSFQDPIEYTKDVEITKFLDH